MLVWNARGGAADAVRRIADRIAATAPGRPLYVVVDGPAEQARTVADRLAAALSEVGRHHARLSDRSPLADEDAWMADRTAGTIVVADGPRWRAQPPSGRWDVLIEAGVPAEQRPT